MTLENWISIVGVIVSLITGLIPTIFQYKENKAKKQKRYELTKQYDIEQKRLQNCKMELNQILNNENKNFNNFAIANSGSSVIQINYDDSTNHTIAQFNQYKYQESVVNQLKEQINLLSPKDKLSSAAKLRWIVWSSVGIIIFFLFYYFFQSDSISNDFPKYLLFFLNITVYVNIALSLTLVLKACLIVEKKLTSILAYSVVALLQLFIFFTPHILNTHPEILYYTGLLLISFENCIFFGSLFVSSIFYNGKSKLFYLCAPYIIFIISFIIDLIIIFHLQNTF